MFRTDGVEELDLNFPHFLMFTFSVFAAAANQYLAGLDLRTSAWICIGFNFVKIQLSRVENYVK